MEIGNCVTGIDGCAGGWVAVTLPAPPTSKPSVTTAATPNELSPPVETAAPLIATVTVASSLDELSLTGVVGIDMTIGLLADGWRDADALARRVLGRRGVTVFAIPPWPVVRQPTYAEANRVCRELTGKGFSIQAWGLRRKILEVDAYRRTATARLYEVHPELAFSVLAGAPLQQSKHTAAGLAIRRNLLAEAGLTLPAKLPGAAENDLLDAAAVACSARRIAAGQAITLTNPAQRADDGTEVAIRY